MVAGFLLRYPRCFSVSSRHTAFVPIRAGYVHRSGSLSNRNGRRGLARIVCSDVEAAAFPASTVSTGTLKVAEISVSALSQFQGDVLVVGLLAPPAIKGNGSDKKEQAPYVLAGEAKALDEQLNGVLSEMIEESKFTGKSGTSEITRISGLSNAPCRKVAIYGLGEIGEDGSLNASIVRQAAAYAVSTVKSSKNFSKVGLFLPSYSDSVASSAADGAVVASFTERRFKSDESSDPAKDVSLTLLSESLVTNQSVSFGETLGRSVIMAKELVMAPPNVLNPTTLAETAQSIASSYGMEISILDREECEKRGMGAYLAVSRGSSYPPKFIHMTYKPSGQVKKKIVIIGKGLTFDSGGYNLKTGFGSMIELMKFDMGGSAVVLGAANAIGSFKPPNVEVHFIVAACENMIAANAYRPGDILKASNGKTIEIGNTDAEGRLTLADALVYADNLGEVDCIVDLATLTGAMIISLGNEYAGLFTPDDALAERLTACAKSAGEKMWRMPLPPEYLELTKSKVADLKNTGGRAGGSITAALFLKEFVKNSSWAHLDIAGTVWSDKDGGPTGYGVRTMIELVQSYSKDQS